MSAPDRRGLLQRDHEHLSIRRQCQLLSVARSSVYRPPRPAHDNDLELMRRIDHMVIDRPNQVWAANLTYVPIGRGFLYLVAIVDWASRAVLAWRLSNTMDTSFCVSALEEALARFGRPEIFNTDQGSQFTSAAFTGTLARRRRQDLDGRSRALDGQRVHRAAVALAQIR